jgi:hypothetical protein
MMRPVMGSTTAKLPQHGTPGTQSRDVVKYPHTGLPLMVVQM